MPSAARSAALCLRVLAAAAAAAVVAAHAEASDGSAKVAGFEIAYWRRILEDGVKGQTTEEVRHAASRSLESRVSGTATRTEVLDAWAQAMAQTARSDPQELPKMFAKGPTEMPRDKTPQGAAAARPSAAPATAAQRAEQAELQAEAELLLKEERRIDPEDGADRTLAELKEHYSGQRSRKEIQKYWEQMMAPAAKPQQAMTPKGPVDAPPVAATYHLEGPSTERQSQQAQPASRARLALPYDASIDGRRPDTTTLLLVRTLAQRPLTPETAALQELSFTTLPPATAADDVAPVPRTAQLSPTSAPATSSTAAADSGPAEGDAEESSECIEEGVSWEPLDMPGMIATEEVDALACQRRCLRTDGCYHFTFWKVYGHCHLQDAFALQRTGRKGFVGGPFQCWDQSQYQAQGLVKVKNGNGHSYLPEQFHCMEVGVSWSPAMKLPRQFDGAESDMILQCQSYCAMTSSCARFTMDVSSGTCQLAEESATALPGVLNSISGPAVCFNQTKDVFMKRLQKKYGDISHARAPSSTSAASWAALLSAGVVFAGFALAALHRRGAAQRVAPSRRRLTDQDEGFPLDE